MYIFASFQLMCERRNTVRTDPASRRKAVTLAEICVVLAVVAIVSTLVASFCLMANHRAAASSNRTQILSEVDAIEKIVESFIDGAVTQNADLSCDGASLGAGENKKITFIEGELSAHIPGREDALTLDCETVESLSFELMTREDEDRDDLVFCTVSCKIPLANGESKTETHVFCVNSRLGESAGG